MAVPAGAWTNFLWSRTSVLNYGIPDLAGRTASSLDTAELEQMIRQAILNFEPRLDRNSVRVRPVVDQRQMNHNALSFDVEAELWAQPLPLRLFLRTAVDLEAGNVEVSRPGRQGEFLMDPRVLGYYNRELQYLREMGGEFAREFPKIAGRLGLESLECSDPYVERLLESFAFLTARVQLKIDDEFPRFSQHLLQMVYPHALAPTPSMAVLELQPNLSEGALADGFRVARGAVLRSLAGRGAETACEYRTAHEVTLWPLELVGAEYTSFLADLGSLRLPGKGKAALRLRLRAAAGLTMDHLALGETAHLPARQRRNCHATLRVADGPHRGAGRPSRGTGPTGVPGHGRCKREPARVRRRAGAASLWPALFSGLSTAAGVLRVSQSLHVL
jgi:type VI secretion system lysozyme-like protein